VLGSTTPSYDLETEIDNTFPTDHITPQLIEETTKQFIGDIQQFPPVFSAIKKDGKRLYEFARAGEDVDIKARQISVEQFEITHMDGLNLDFRIVCSKGTYIRSLAHDFGKALGSGAHLSALRRTKIGDFNVVDGVTVVDFIVSLND
jgi:tRNA pseudouridine55 synthase